MLVPYMMDVDKVKKLVYQRWQKCPKSLYLMANEVIKYKPNSLVSLNATKCCFWHSAYSLPGGC
jgi:hypothetical protein